MKYDADESHTRKWGRWACAHFKEHLGLVLPWTREQVLETRDPSVRQRYADAYASLDLRRLSREDAKISAFIKNEKVDEIKDKPRLIQARTPRFNAEIARYLAPYERALYKSDLGKHFTKGLNSFQKAEALLRLSMLGNDLVYINLDATAYDSSEGVPLLKMESKAYSGAMPCSKLQMMLSWQRSNHGRTRFGIKYFSKGRRMSGDYNTSLGNGTNMYVIIKSWLLSSGVEGDFILDGDDSVVVVRRADVGKLDPAWFAKFGVDIKMIRHYSIYDVKFCQSRLISTSNGYRLVRDPIRMLSHAPYCIDAIPGAGWKKWCSAVGDCELACNGGVPVLQEYALMMKRAGGGERPLVNRCFNRARAETTRQLPITPEARADMWSITGWTVQQQLALEEMFRDCRFTPGSTVLEVCQRSPQWAILQ